ncbi:Sorbin and SH3 domain-containing protein 1 [Desmophyllum pertusum]|uniref:Sorbin and SH3 domain-containing protein 1 n=1 Tax=Desmophyllum pertusum TaxID=174260 RepID=A0A9X0CL92_9CNID|nr:Sorbin and SH3 domain-containing protein 1 [Desmophyllum pertusum]
MASSEVYEVVLSGGAPWGFRLQGGKEFRAPLRIAKVTPSSKAETAGIIEGLLVRSINNASCEDWTHGDALNSIKKTGSMLKLILSRRAAPSPEPNSTSGTFFTSSSSKTTDDINTGRSTHVTKATFKPSSSNEVLSYATMPRGGEKKDVDMKRWRDVEENNNENAFTSQKDDLSDGNEWNPDIISGVVRPPEQIKLVHGMEAIRSVSSSSTSSEPSIHMRAPMDSRGFTDKPRPIGRGGRRFDERGFQTTGTNPQLTSESIGSEEDFNMILNGDASSSDSAPSVPNRPAMQQFKKQKEQAAFEATKEPKPVRVAPPTRSKPPRKYSDERKLSETTNIGGPHRPSIQRGGKWYKEMFKELHSSGRNDHARGTVRDYEGGSGSSSPPRSASPSPDHRDEDVFIGKSDYVNEAPVRNTYTSNVSSQPVPAWSSNDNDRKASWQQSGEVRRPSRPSASHVPTWYKDMQKGVEVPVQTIEEPESYLVQKRPSYANVGEERRFQEPVSSAPTTMNVSPTYQDQRRSTSSVTVQMEEKNQPPSATSLYESRFQRRSVPTRTASEELQVRQQPPSDEDMLRRREEEATRRRWEEEEHRRVEEEERRQREEEVERRRREEEERLRREYEAEVLRRRREEEAARREASKPQFLAKALYSFQGQTEKYVIPKYMRCGTRELSFRKNDIINVRRQVDKNWIDGELNGKRGIFPTNYVEIRPVEEDEEEEDEPPPPPPAQKQVLHVQVVQQQQHNNNKRRRSSVNQQLTLSPRLNRSHRSRVSQQLTLSPRLNRISPQQHQPAAYAQPQQISPQPRQPAAYAQPQAQQISPRPSAQQATQSVTVEGEARVRYTFKSETQRELPCNKGDIIALVRKVDANWYEGRVDDRKGIVPSSYLEVFREPEVQVLRQEQVQAVQSARVEQAPDFDDKNLVMNNGNRNQGVLQGFVYAGQAAPAKSTQVKYIEEPEEPRFSAGGVVAHAVIDEPMRIGHEQGERYRALFSYEPINEDELRLEEGDEVIVLEKCDDGWFVGTSARTHSFGTFPGNYVERVAY